LLKSVHLEVISGKRLQSDLTIASATLGFGILFVVENSVGFLGIRFFTKRMERMKKEALANPDLNPNMISRNVVQNEVKKSKLKVLLQCEPTAAQQKSSTSTASVVPSVPVRITSKTENKSDGNPSKQDFQRRFMNSLISDRPSECDGKSQICEWSSRTREETKGTNQSSKTQAKKETPIQSEQSDLMEPSPDSKERTIGNGNMCHLTILEPESELSMNSVLKKNMEHRWLLFLTAAVSHQRILKWLIDPTA